MTLDDLLEILLTPRDAAATLAPLPDDVRREAVAVAEDLARLALAEPPALPSQSVRARLLASAQRRPST